MDGHGIRARGKPQALTRAVARNGPEEARWKRERRVRDGHGQGRGARSDRETAPHRPRAEGASTALPHCPTVRRGVAEPRPDAVPVTEADRDARGLRRATNNRGVRAGGESPNL